MREREISLLVEKSTKRRELAPQGLILKTVLAQTATY